MHDCSRILVVEPNSVERQRLASYLCQAGWSVHGTSSGARARIAIASEEIDGAVIGQYVPDVPAIDLISFGRRRAPRLPILFLINSDPSGHDESAALKNGATATLHQPVSMEVFLATCRRIFERTNTPATSVPIRPLS